MTPFEFLVQVIGFVGIALNILSVQFNKHWQIMLLKTLGSMTFVLQYILLGAWVGMVMDLIGSIRNVIFTLNVKNGRSNKGWIIAFSIITFIAGLVTIITTWDKSIGYASNWSKRCNESEENFSSKIINNHRVRIQRSAPHKDD